MTRARLFSLISLLAIITGVLVSVAGASQATAAVNPAMTPPGTQTAVKDADIIGLGGTVGPDAQSVSSALVKVFGPSGNHIFTLDRTSKTSVSGTTIQGGSFELFRSYLRASGAPEEDWTKAHGGRIDFEVKVQFSDGPSTGSTSLPIDLVAPVIDAASLRRTPGGQAREIEVKFSERVLHPDGSDLASDWTAQDVHTFQPYPVNSVCCHELSDRRLLTLSTDANEDSELLVDFTPTQVGRDDYVDKAGNFLGTTTGPDGNACQCRVAKDDIPPAIPSILRIDGEDGTNAAGNDSTPTVRVGNINNGNTALVYVEKTPGPGARWSADDELYGQATANATREADVTLSDLGGDGPFTLWAVARDPGGNSSGDGTKGDYLLDRVQPRGLVAGTNGNTLDVFFTEPINGARIQANWSVNPPGPPTGVPSSVTGANGTDHRFLTLPAGAEAPDQANVKWEGSDATDRAGNSLPHVELTASNKLAPFARISQPAGEVYEAGSTYTIKGTVANNASSIRVFRDDDDNGVADSPGSPVSTASVSGGAFSVQVPLRTGPSVDNDFVVNATRTDLSPAVTGPYVDVPTIIQDNTDPVVTVQAPEGGQALPGERVFKVRWQASDAGSSTAAAAAALASFGPTPITIEYSTDGGTAWEKALDADGNPAEQETNDGEFDWLVPDVNTTQALVRASAQDRALRVGSGQSGLFTIDADNPFFGAQTIDTSHIEVHFNEPVKGFANALEWRIDGAVAKSVSPAGSVSGITKLTLETFQPFGKSATPEITYAVLSPPTQLTDQVGNVMSPTSATAADGIAPGAPTVTEPTTPVFTGADRYNIKGAAEEGSLVTVYRDEGNDGTPDVEAGSQQLGPGQTLYDVAATLQDGANEFLVVASDQAGNDSPGADVATINADVSAPVVNVIRPAGGELVGGGDEAFTVVWTAFDPNLAQDSISIEYSTDGGATFQEVAGNEQNDGDFSFPLPNQAVKSGMIRVSARDTFDRVGSATSGAFEVIPCDIIGTRGNDVLTGTDRGETICSYDGDDIVNGKGGDDTILSGLGRKRIDAGSGDDLVEGGPSDDLIRGGSGDDTLRGNDGNDQVLGDEGRDLVVGGNGDDKLRGGTSNDRLLGESGNDRLGGDSGNDALNGAEGNDRLKGGDGNDGLLGEAGNDKLRGDAGNDVLKGGTGNDRLSGGANNDRLAGMHGRDRLNGGKGNDRLSGGKGKDKCRPGSGVNRVTRSC